MNNSQNFLSPTEKKAMHRVFQQYRQKRKQALANQGLDQEKFRSDLREIKEISFKHWPELKEKAIRNLKRNGINVFWAEDEGSARQTVERLLADKKKIVRAKSNAYAEIHQEGFLSDKEITETDLGDFIVKLIGEKSAHPVLPAAQFSIDQIISAIKDEMGVELPAEPKSVVAYLRSILREKIVSADAAITGANIITADGSIVFLENEGNISLVSRIPSTHIIVSGFEKIVDNLEQAMMLARASAIWGTGQEMPSYVSIISGPSKTADIEGELVTGAQGAKEVNLILLDNGRQKLIEAGLEELLYCLNCGGCLNFCPAFRELGRCYGDAYQGTKGIVFAAFSKGPRQAQKANCFACTLCSACQENCPLRINLPELMKKTRAYLADNNVGTEANREMLEKIKKFGNPFGPMDKGQIPDQLYCC